MNPVSTQLSSASAATVTSAGIQSAGTAMGKPAAKAGVLSLAIRDKQALYSSYMPFIRNGGLFVPTAKTYGLGDEVFVLLTLMDNKAKVPVAGKVVWINPRNAQNQKAAGIGLQFDSKDQGRTRAQIENYLAGGLQSERPTHTM